MGIGELLRSERENRGLTLNEVEDATKIRASYIRALEEEKFEDLPGEVYCLGFLRNYARFLGLDQQGITDQYKSSHTSVVRDTAAIRSVPDPRVFAPNYRPLLDKIASAGSIFKNRRLLLGGAAVIVCLLLIWAVAALVHRERTAVPVPPQVQLQQNMPANPAQQGTLEIKLVGRQDCWAQVRVDNKDSFEGIVHNGETRTFSAQTSVRVKLGNAGGVDVYENGSELPPLGNMGAVVTKEFTRNPGA